MGTREVNSLIAAALRHREALRTGQGPSHQAQLVAAVDVYVEARSELDAARDRFLIEYPDDVGLAEAIAALEVHGAKWQPPVVPESPSERPGAVRPWRNPLLGPQEPAERAGGATTTNS